MCNSETETSSWLKLWISLEEKASTTALFCTSYPGNGKAEISVFPRLTRFEFIPPRSTGGYMNLLAHLVRKMPLHLFKLNFCAVRHAEFMALRGRTAEEPNSVPGNKNKCVSRCVYRMLCAHSTLHQHWREKVIHKKERGFFFPWWGTKYLSWIYGLSHLFWLCKFFTSALERKDVEDLLKIISDS